MPEEITLGSFCSGSEGFHTVLEAVQNGLTNHWTHGDIKGKATPKLRQVWMSEIVPQKREWEMLVNTEETCCCFGDVRGLGTSRISWPSQWNSGWPNEFDSCPHHMGWAIGHRDIGHRT